MLVNDGVFRVDEERELHNAARAKRTPRTRASSKDESITEARRTAASLADPQNGICLISRDHVPVQTCHLLARASEGELLTKLEWAWGLAYHSLHVDTRFNLIHLNYNLHSLFDSNYWFLIPEANIVEKLLKYTVTAGERAAEDPPRQHRDIRKVLGDGPFKYYFIPTPKMADVLVHRRVLRHPRDSPEPPSAENHVYPFDTLPSVWSHALPHFVIYNSGAKMQKLTWVDIRPDTLLQRIPKLSQTLSSVPFLYDTWRRITVPALFDSNVPAHSSRLPQPPRSGDDGSPQGPPAKRTRSATRTSSNHTSQAGGSNNHGGAIGTLKQQHGLRPTNTATTPDLAFSDGDSATADDVNMQMEDDEDFEDFEDDEVEDEEDDTAFENRMHAWQESSALVVEAEGWEKDLHKDSQLDEYVEESPRPVPELPPKSSAISSQVETLRQPSWMGE